MSLASGTVTFLFTDIEGSRNEEIQLLGWISCVRGGEWVA
jgi:hypothetical protein